MHEVSKASDYVDAETWPAILTRTMPDGIALRRECEDDLDFARDLYSRLRAPELALVLWPEAAKRDFLHDQFRLQRRHYLAVHGAADFLIVMRAAPPWAPVAIGRLYVDRSAPLWSIVDISLSPGEQGKGTGAALVRAVQNSAGAQRAQGIELHVAVENKRAKALYLRLGFQQVPADHATHDRMIWSST
jgi:ribosomal protein S18 acetylase RimI-like enzyme